MRRSLIALTILMAGAAATSGYADSGHPQYGTWGFDLSAMDKSVKPGDDFFMYANGNWYKTAVIPPDRAATGAFQDLRILSEKRMLEIAASLDAKPYDQLSDEEKKLRDLYDAYLDQKQIDAKGMAPAEQDLKAIANLKTLNGIAELMGDPSLNLDGPVGVGIGINDKNPNAYSINLGQAGLGMPDRDYYLRKNDPDLEKARAAYKKHLAAMFALAGLKNGDARAQGVYDLEARMAEADWPNEDRRDEDKVYNPMTYGELKALAPQFPWDSFFKRTGLPLTPDRQVIVAEKSAFPKLAAIFASTPVATWRDYLTVHYLHSYASYLPKAVDDENFAFYGAVLQGNAQQLPRATRAAHLLDNTMGEALGKLYVAKYFPPAAKAKAVELVHNLLKAYEADIQSLDWMSPETKAKAEDKIRKFTIKIGYPDKWRDYSALVIKRDDLLGDVKRANLFEWNRQSKRINQPTDKTEWGMSPPTVNAYNNSQWNEIVFPAAIMQPPFFDFYADDAVNYGGIGAVIGHEISHGFDDQGSKFDSDGVFNNWWTAQDRKTFDAKTTALGKQYSSYEPLPGLHVNGAFTMGENVADNAGVAIALKAYHISLGGKPAPVIDGLTGDQRFYLGFAQIWRGKLRDGALRQQVLSNEHSPPQFRAIGATRNQDDWYNAFDVKGGKYYLPPDQRVHLW
jgi:putative endopeptidase